MKLKAKIIPWSSVTGTGVILFDEDDKAAGVGALMSVTTATPDQRKARSLELARYLAKIINEAVEK